MAEQEGGYLFSSAPLLLLLLVVLLLCLCSLRSKSRACEL